MPVGLVVDDDDGVRNVFREALEAAGFEVDTAPNARHALKQYRRRRPDVVISDVLMPKLSGVELVNQLLVDDPHAKIIAISGVLGSEFLEGGREIGVRKIFEKPVDVHVIVA